MITNVRQALRLLPAAALVFAAISLPALATAQPAPSYAVHEDTIHGTVSHFDGQYTLYINDDRGFMDRVALHQGTIINPTGITLREGYAVTIIGHPAGNTFIANEIDTPYHYGHRHYGYGYPYYGPVIGVGFGFGGYGYRGYGGYGYRGWR